MTNDINPRAEKTNAQNSLPVEDCKRAQQGVAKNTRPNGRNKQHQKIQNIKGQNCLYILDDITKKIAQKVAGTPQKVLALMP